MNDMILHKTSYIRSRLFKKKVDCILFGEEKILKCSTTPGRFELPIFATGKQRLAIRPRCLTRIENSLIYFIIIISSVHIILVLSPVVNLQ